MRRQLTPDEALSRLNDLCNASEQCSTDLLRKMAAWHIPASASADIIRKLKIARLVDDARFCGAYARDKMRYNAWGRYKIRMALMAKHIDHDIIDESLDSLDADEYAEAAERCVRNALRRINDPDDYPSRMKLMRQCAARGFETRLIADTLNRITKEKREMP